MPSGLDLADLIAYAGLVQDRSGRGISQLAGGGGRRRPVLLAGRSAMPGSANGPVPRPWEQRPAAAARRRHAVLAEYDQHGRIIGGDPSKAMDAARRLCRPSAGGTDTLLMATTMPAPRAWTPDPRRPHPPWRSSTAARAVAIAGGPGRRR